MQLICKGDNDLGQLNVPVDLDQSNITNLAAGQYHNCASDTRHLNCWGDNKQGQLNVPKDLDQSNIRHLSAGANNNCAADSNQLKCWGDNDDGQLKVPKDLDQSNITNLATGQYHNCASDTNQLKCWGSNKFGQLNVPEDLEQSNITNLTGGGFHNCAADTKQLICWGRNDHNQLIKKSLLYFTDNIDSQIINSSQNIQCVKQNLIIRCDTVDGINTLYDKKIKLKSDQLNLNLDKSIVQYDPLKNILVIMSVCSNNLSVLCILNITSSVIEIKQFPINIVSITGGHEHACILLENKEVQCYGGSKIYQENLLPKEMNQNVNAVMAGKNRTCVLKLTQVICNGKNIDNKVDYTIQNDNINK